MRDTTAIPHHIDEDSTVDPDHAAVLVDHLLEQARAISESDPRAALPLFERARELAKNHADASGQAWASLEAAGCHQDLGDYDAAAVLLPDAIARFAALGDLDGLSHARNIAGILAIDLGGFEEAIRELTAAVDGFRQAGKPEMEAAALYNLGKAHLRLGDHAASLDYFLGCAGIEETVAAPVDRALTYGSISSVCRDLGRHDAALDYAERALVLVDPVAERKLLSTTIIELGLSLAAAGRGEEALARLAEALAVAEEAIHPARARDAASHLATLLIQLGRHTEAGPHAESALAISRQLGERYAEARALLLAWDAAVGPQSSGHAFDAARLERALAIAREIGAVRIQRDAHERLARAHEGRRDHFGAVRHLHALIEIERRLFDEDADLRSRALTIRHETERARKEAEIERLRNVELAAANEELRRAGEQTAALLAQVQEQSILLQRQATEDPLTGLANRRSLDQQLARELERAARFGHPLAVAMLDLDHFKTINDRFSHQMGDLVLQEVAGLLRQGARDVDVVARYGGEEFTLLFPETPLSEAVAVCERLRRAVATHAWSTLHSELTVTVSIGVVTAEPGDNPIDACRRADACLYEAKRLGRNRVTSPAFSIPIPTAA